MSVGRPLGRLLASAATPFRARTFTSAAAAQYPRVPTNPRPSNKSNTSSSSTAVSRGSAMYTDAQLEELSSHFSHEQLSALLAGEQAIDRADFSRRAPRREGDPFSLPYLDDLSVIDPVLDFLPEKTTKKMRSLGETTTHGGVTKTLPKSSLPRSQDPDIKYDDADSEGNLFRKLSQATGMPLTELKTLRTRLMLTHSVTNQTRMGKIRKVYALAVAGNGNGLLGVGEGKAVESEDAIRQATYMAMRNMEPIPRYENRTIYGDVEVKQGAVEMKVFTRPPGLFPSRPAHHDLHHQID